MEALLFITLIVITLLMILIRDGFTAKKKEKLFVNSLYEQYGHAPEKKYTPERFERINGYFEKHRQEKEIDDITWNDLNLDEIFKRIDCCYSSSGEEYLYATLRNMHRDQEELDHLEEVVDYFDANPQVRVKVQYLLSQLGHTGKYSLYEYIDNLDYLGERSNVRHIIKDLLFIPLIVLLPFYFQTAICGLILLIIINILTYFKEKNEIDPYVISFAYIIRLLVICEKLLQINVPVCSKEWELIRCDCTHVKKLRKGSWLLMASRSSITGGNPLDIIMDYLRMGLHLDLIQFNRMLRLLRNHESDVDGLITQVGYLDTAIAIGSFRRSLPGYCVPKLYDTSVFQLTDAYHPLLEHAVRNSITAEKGVLLTGSNASGKSTFLKTVAVNAVLAQTIHTCTAAEYSAPFYDIYTSMALRDDMQNGESYYIVEIKALKRILDAAGKSDRAVLCLVDEVLRGTNTVERIAASTQILRSLSGKNILCFAATHDIELTELLKDVFDNYHFEEEIIDDDIVFPYKLLVGKATTRNAIKLLELMGYDDKVIQKAMSQAAYFTENGVWSVGGKE